GLAMAVVQTGQAIGGVLIFPLVALAVLNLGWRTAAVLSGLVVLMLLPLVLFIRRSPESMGLLPDGEAPSSHDLGRVAHGIAAASGESREFTTREALRPPTFWPLAPFHGLPHLPPPALTPPLPPLSRSPAPA